MGQVAIESNFEKMVATASEVRKFFKKDVNTFLRTDALPIVKTGFVDIFKTGGQVIKAPFPRKKKNDKNWSKKRKFGLPAPLLSSMQGIYTGTHAHSLISGTSNNNVHLINTIQKGTITYGVKSTKYANITVGISTKSLKEISDKLMTNLATNIEKRIGD